MNHTIENTNEENILFFIQNMVNFVYYLLNWIYIIF